MKSRKHNKIFIIEKEYEKLLQLYFKESDKVKKRELAVQLDFMISNIRPMSDYYE